MLQCVFVDSNDKETNAVCCSVLQCVAVCCSVLQKWHSRCNRHSLIWIVDLVLLKGPLPVCRSALQCVAVCCSVLQCVDVCCRNDTPGAIGTLKSHSLISFFSHACESCHIQMSRVSHEWVMSHMHEQRHITYKWVMSHMNESCPISRSIRSITKCVAVCRSVLQCAAVCCSVLQCIAVCCSVLQCVAVCCSVLQCNASFYNEGAPSALSLILLYRTKVTIYIVRDSYTKFVTHIYLFCFIGAPAALSLIWFYRTKVTHIHSSWLIYKVRDPCISFSFYRRGRFRLVRMKRDPRSRDWRLRLEIWIGSHPKFSWIAP